MDFKLPDLGEGVAEGEIVKWLVSEGQDIKEDQPMVEVMTDKATVQIPSPTTGKVRQILAKEGQTVKVGTTVVVLDSPNGKNVERQEEKTAARNESQSIGETEAKPTGTQESSQRIIATPATRKLARELNVTLESVHGSGPGGRITEDDVRNASIGKKTGFTTQAQTVTEPRREQQPEFALPPRAPSTSMLRQEERIPIHGIRKRISEKMSKSVHTAAHVLHVDEVDYSELILIREAAKEFTEEKGTKMTYLPFIMKAVALSLKEFPYFNASIDDEKNEIILKHYYNIGFATDTSNGLIVPVVKDVDRKRITDISSEIEQLAEQARKGTISLEHIQGGTFTITNIGNLGGVMAAPIINHPEVAILGVSKFQKRPVVRDDMIVIRPMGYISLSFDHRIVDGADAARFTSRLIKYLEAPSSLLFEAL